MTRKQIHAEFLKISDLVRAIDTGDSDTTDLQIAQACSEIAARAGNIRRAIDSRPVWSETLKRTVMIPKDEA